MQFVRIFFSFPILVLVKIYQLIISPLYAPTCRFNPTCSQYMIVALKTWGPIKGTWLGIRRIGKCHPWGSFGDDPVPEKNKKST